MKKFLIVVGLVLVGWWWLSAEEANCTTSADVIIALVADDDAQAKRMKAKRGDVIEACMAYPEPYQECMGELAERAKTDLNSLDQPYKNGRTMLQTACCGGNGCLGPATHRGSETSTTS